MNRVAAFNPIRIDNPTPISDIESNAETEGDERSKGFLFDWRYSDRNGFGPRNVGK